MQRTLKFAHTIGAIGLMGAMASLLAMLAILPDPASSNTTDLARYAGMREAMHVISQYILIPSLGLTLVAGLFSIAANRIFQNAGWAMLKLVTGIVMFEWTLIGIDGPMRREADLSAQALVGAVDVADLGVTIDRVWWSLWVLIAIAVLNVVLGIWRPKLKRKDHFAKDPSSRREPPEQKPDPESAHPGVRQS